MSYGVGGTKLGEICDYCPHSCKQEVSPAWYSRIHNANKEPSGAGRQLRQDKHNFSSTAL